MADCLWGVSECLESDLRSSVETRTRQLEHFHDLGPPDLCHIIKSEKGKPVGLAREVPRSPSTTKSATPSNSAHATTQIGSYHFVTGTDVSSSAALASYFHPLNVLVEEAGVQAHARTAYQLRSGLYCCWNAFSDMDVRVEVKIPGGVDAYAIVAATGEKLHALTPQHWQETHVSAILRALAIDKDSVLFASNFNAMQNQPAIFYQQVLAQLGIRTLNPFPSAVEEGNFLEAAKQQFSQGEQNALVGGQTSETRAHLVGWKLGSANLDAAPSLVNNHLSQLLLQYFQETKRYQMAIDFFKPTLLLDGNIAALLAPCYFALDQEITGFELLHSAAIQGPLLSVDCLRAQAQHLWKNKKRYDLATELYRYVVELSPSEPIYWLELAELYIDDGKLESALLTLNATPIDLPSATQYIPTPLPGADRLHAMQQHSAFVYRSFTEQVQVLHPPARYHIPINHEAHVPQEIHKDMELVISSPGGNRGLQTQLALQDPVTFFVGVNGIRDACDVAVYRLQAPLMKGNLFRAYLILAKISTIFTWERLLNARGNVFVMEDEYKEQHDKEEKQAQEEMAATSSPRGSTVGATAMLPPVPIPPRRKSLAATRIHNKRLCERWLDGMFMVLYEDLRVFTFFQTDYGKPHAERKTFQRTPLEWELLGDLCFRLGHYDRARECYEHCTATRYAFRVWFKLLDLYMKAKQLKSALVACDKLLCTLDRWKWGKVMEPSSPICLAVLQMVSLDGDVQVRQNISALKTSKRNEQLLLEILDWVRTLLSVK